MTVKSVRDLLRGALADRRVTPDEAQQVLDGAGFAQVVNGGGIDELQ